jgi:hypothetical protein
MASILGLWKIEGLKGKLLMGESKLYREDDRRDWVVRESRHRNPDRRDWVVRESPRRRALL